MGDSHCSTCRCSVNIEPCELESLDINALLRDPSFSSSSSYPNPELDRILALAVAAKAELPGIAALLNDLKKRLAALESRQAQITLQVAKCEALASPIRNLPDDILIEIFHYCAGKGTEIMPSNPPGHSRHLPFYSLILDLSGVCHRWRDLVMSQHSLWTGFSTMRSLAMEPRRRQQAAMKLVERHLRWAGDLPLSLELHFFSRANTPLPPVVSALLAERSRARSFSLTTTYSSIIDSFRADDQYPVLEYLDLDIIRSIGGIIDVFSNTPRLQTVVLSGITLDYIILPWSNLRSLTLKEVDICDALRIAAQTNHLQTLHLSHLSGAQHYPEDTIAEVPIRSLEISSRYICQCIPAKPGSDLFEELFLNLRCPNLSTLSVQEFTIHYGGETYRTCKEPPRFNVPSFYKFLSNSSKLTTLSLQCLHMSEEHLLHLLQCAPTVTSLTLEPYDTEISNTFFTRLSFSEASYAKPLLPRLKNFSLATDFKSFTLEAVVDMIKSRHRHSWPDAAQLRFFGWLINESLTSDISREIDVAAEFERIEGLATFVRHRQREE